ncbi:MAG TPA: DUF5011 domain-containing protein, partial [Crocinitomix sp.]|nr:DUF5011 domain-containing protein [Crocinitomix sp.]
IHEFELVVTDADANEARDKMIVTVSITSATLTVDAGVDKSHQVSASNRQVYLTGTATEGAAIIEKYEWFKDGQSIGLGASIWFTLIENGTHKFELVVTDIDANEARDEMLIMVTNGTGTENNSTVDEVKPVITLLGNSIVNLIVGDAYIEAGAIAIDNINGDITPDIIVNSSVNIASEGNYTVSYNVSDSVGNSADTVIRKVNVQAAPVLTQEIVLCQNKSAYLDVLYQLGMTINSPLNNGSVFAKDNNFVGAVICGSFSNVNSSADILNRLKGSAFPSATNIITTNNTDGSVTAQYEVNSVNLQAYAQLKKILEATGETDFLTYIDYTTLDLLQDMYIDIYVNYVDLTTTYITVTVTNKAENNVVLLNRLVSEGTISTSNNTNVITDTFNYQSNTLKADILFVMDDSGSMRQEQRAASDAITTTFGSAMAVNGVDWKATVIGTEEGRDYLHKHIDNPSENNISKLASQLLLGTRGGDEVGLKRAYQYLNNGDIIVRNGSKLSMVFISDETAHTELFELDAVDINDTYFVQNGIKVNIIIPQGLNINSNLAFEMANVTGGKIANLYNYATGYSAMMQEIADNAAGSASTIILSEPPIIASIHVLVNGVSNSGWTYNTSNNSIVFNVASTPNTGDQITVRYNKI